MRTRPFWLVAQSALLSACAGAPSGDTGAPLTTSSATLVSATASAQAAPTATPAAEAGLALYPVAEVPDFLDFAKSVDGVWLRVGVDPGGGAVGAFRYVPVVDGLPDFAHETPEITYADTTGAGFVELWGQRPDLKLHVVSGFRGGAEDRYFGLAGAYGWQVEPLSPASGIGARIDRWPGNRWIELRAESRQLLWNDPELPSLPSFRIVKGDKKTVPVIPPAREKELIAAGFRTEVSLVSERGFAIVVGRLKGGGLGTLVFPTEVSEPSYFKTEVTLTEETAIEISGASALANARLTVGGTEFKLDTAQRWVATGTKDAAGLLTLKNGIQLRYEQNKAAFRTAADKPWQPLPGPEGAEIFNLLVDDSGTVWASQGSWLLSSKKPAKAISYDAATLVAERQRSLLRGGSPDLEPMRTSGANGHCKNNFLVLAGAPVEQAPKNYPKLEAVLLKNKKFDRSMLRTTREGGWEFFGVQGTDWELLHQLDEALTKADPKQRTTMLCAQPVAKP